MGSDPTFRQRTDWAEHFIAQLASQSLISEYVFHSPQRTDKTQKEVVDILLTLAGQTIIVSIKCQQDPGSRSPNKEAKWVAKATAGAVRQTKGALRALQGSDYWCDHSRRGRVQFVAGQLRPAHAVVLVETLERVSLPVELPLHHGGVPISFFSANDFCNVVQQLRTIPEIVAYLDARRALPADALRTIGVSRRHDGDSVLAPG